MFKRFCLGAYPARRTGIDHLADQQSWKGSFPLTPAQAFIRLRARCDLHLGQRFGDGDAGNWYVEGTAMGMTRYFFYAVLCLASIWSLPSSGMAQVTMETQPWPASYGCVDCVPLQFGALSMRLPSTLVGGIFISATALAQLHIIPAGADIKTSFFFHTLPSAHIAGKYRSLIALPSDPQLFFDQLGVPVPASNPWSKIRTVEQLDKAVKYTKASRGATHVYWIRGSLTNSHHLYVVIDGSPLVYAIDGELTPAWYDAILSNLVITPEP